MSYKFKRKFIVILLKLKLGFRALGIAFDRTSAPMVMFEGPDPLDQA